MAARVTTLEQANGIAYILRDSRYSGPVILLFRRGDLAPLVQWGGSPGYERSVRWVGIDDPERYGPWSTHRQRTAYIKRFAEDRVVTTATPHAKKMAAERRAGRYMFT